MNIVRYIIDIAARGDNTVIRRISGLQNRLESADAAATRLATSVGNSLKTAFMSLPGASFFTNPIVAMTAGIGAVSRLGMQAQTTATAFNVLVGSQEKSSAILGDLYKYADDTIWDRKELIASAQTMLGFGSSVETVTSDLKMLGDIAMGDKNRLQQLALVFGQISSAGKLQGQDLMQLVNAGYNPLQDIAKMTGQTMSEVRKQMSDGAIGIDMVRKAMKMATSEGGRYDGMTEKLAETSAGKFDQMKGAASKALLDIYKIIEPLLIPTFEKLTSMLTWASEKLEGIANAANWVFNLFKSGNPIMLSLTAGIGALTAAAVINTTVLKGWTIAERVHFAWLVLAEKAQKLWNFAMAANPIGLVIAGISALVVGLVACWNKFAGFRAVILTVWDTMKGFAGLIKDLVISRIQSLLQSVGKVGEALGKLFKGDFSGAWQSAKEAGSLFLNVDGARQAVNSARNIVSGIPQNYRTRLDAERTKQKAKEAISDPKAAAGVADNVIGTAGIPAAEGSTSAKDIANDVTTGGARNTQISIRVDKFFDGGITVQSSNTTDMSKLKRTILECINRSLEIGLSAAR